MSKSRTENVKLVEALKDLLDLENLEHNLFRGHSPRSDPSSALYRAELSRVFGGQVMAQALVAARRTVPDERLVHSLHGYFMRPGDPNIPIVYEVDRIRDGGSFTTRRVVALQRGQAIFSMQTSFHIEEPGLEHYQKIEIDENPENLPDMRQMLETFGDRVSDTVRAYWNRPSAFDVRASCIDHYVSDKKLEGKQNVWIKAKAPVAAQKAEERAALHAALLVYCSDLTLLDTSLFPHGRSLFDPQIQGASLDHAVWFHRPVNMDDWILYAQDTPNSRGGRGFTRGLLYGRDGTLIASCAQEGLIRLKDPAYAQKRAKKKK